MKAVGTSTKIFYTALAAAVTVLVLYVYIFMKILDENHRVNVLADSVRSETEKKENLASMAKRITATAPERQKLDGYFISKDGVVPFLNFIQSLGTQNELRLKILSVDVVPADPASDIFEIAKISFEARGVWGNVYRMAALSELMPQGVSVDRVDIVKMEDTASQVEAQKKAPPKDPEWQVHVNLSILKLK